MELKEKIAKLQKDSWYAHVISVLKEIHGDPLPEIIQKGIVDIAENKNVPQKQIANWVGNLSAVGEKIESGKGCGSDFSVFWIRLHEMLDYLPSYFQSFNELKLYPKITKILSEIKGTYTTEELVMIEYQRHCHSHIHQSGYRIKATYNKEGKLNEKEGHLYKGKDKIDLKEMINTELQKYKVDEEKMAIEYFKKTKEKIDLLWREIKIEFRV